MGYSGSAVPGLVSYPLCEVLGSHRCGCGLDVVLCLLVSLLGRVVFVVFSKIYMVLGGDFHCSTHAAILVLSEFNIFEKKKVLNVFLSRKL